jgi:hypothetical protein
MGSKSARACLKNTIAHACTCVWGLFESVLPVLVRTPTAVGDQVGIGHVVDDESAMRQPGRVPPAVLDGFHKGLIVRFSLERADRIEANKTNEAIIEDSFDPRPATYRSPARSVDQEA